MARNSTYPNNTTNWLYKHNRLLFTKQMWDEKGIAAFVFFVSYNDAAGGGTLSDAAIQAVIDNYPTMFDAVSADTNTDYYKKLNGGTLSNGTTVAGFNNLTSQQAIDIFGYKQTMAAYIRQIISLSTTSANTPYIFLTTMNYSVPTSTDAGTTSATERANRKSLNDCIYEISEWFGGIPVIDVNKGGGYMLGNGAVHSSDVHFDATIKERMGYYVTSEILKYQIND
jgi:hypothetical protein